MTRGQAIARRSELEGLIRRTAPVMAMLRAARACDAPDGVIGAGLIRNLVWDDLHGRPFQTPRDVDFAFFDPHDLRRERDHAVEAELRRLLPDVPWEATNQAAVHRWFQQVFGEPVAPLRSIEEAVATWPETATAVAVRLDRRDQIEVIAPFGLSDLFGGRLRRNARRVSVAEFRRRYASKQVRTRWPGIEVIDIEAPPPVGRRAILGDDRAASIFDESFEEELR
jgi:hypothetical protein